MTSFFKQGSYSRQIVPSIGLQRSKEDAGTTGGVKYALLRLGLKERNHEVGHTQWRKELRAPFPCARSGPLLIGGPEGVQFAPKEILVAQRQHQWSQGGGLKLECFALRKKPRIGRFHLLEQGQNAFLNSLSALFFFGLFLISKETFRPFFGMPLLSLLCTKQIDQLPEARVA